MFNKKFLIIITLLFSTLLIISSVSAEEINGVVSLEEDNAILNEDVSLTDDLEENGDNCLDAGEEIIENDGDNDISDSIEDDKVVSKSKLSASNLGDTSKNSVFINDVSVYENQDIYVTILSNYSAPLSISYYINVDDFNLNTVFFYSDLVVDGKSTKKIKIGKLPAGVYDLYYYDQTGLYADSTITVKSIITPAQITVTNYNSYYKSGKAYTIKVINKTNNKPISNLKLKLTYTSKGKSKVSYATTNSQGIAKPKVALGVGTYKLTVSSTNSKVKPNAARATVKVRPWQVKITVPNYSSYYKSGKKLSVKAINKSSNKGISVKLKFVYKKAKAKAKVVYVTTNKKGIAKVKIPVGIGKYKLTVTSANSNFKVNKLSRKVNVNKYVIFKAGKYRGKLTYKQVLALKKAKANGKDLWVQTFTGKYFTYKEPIYKTVYIKRSRWDYKYKLSSEDWWDEYGSDWETYNPKTPKGYTWCGTVYKSGNGWSKTYYKYKKKVYYWDTKEVNTGKYKKVKDKIYMVVSTNSGEGQYGKCDLIEVWSSGYWYVHADNIITKEINL